MNIILKNLPVKKAVAMANKFKHHKFIFGSEENIRRIPNNLNIVPVNEVDNKEADIVVKDEDDYTIYSQKIAVIGEVENVCKVLEMIEQGMETQDELDKNYWWADQLELFINISV